MLTSREELKREAADILGISEQKLTFLPLSVTGSMTGQIEEGFDGSIFCLGDDLGNRYVAKRKCKSFTENVGVVMDYQKQPDFQEQFRKGYRIFCIEDSFLREKYLYQALSDQFDYALPHYYGSMQTKEECLILMECIEICCHPINNTAVACFLADLHTFYWNDADFCAKNRVHFTREEDYPAAALLTERLFENIAVIYPDFPKDVLEELLIFARAGEENYQILTSGPRTLCQGDFCVKNLSFRTQGICVYDWELAAYNHPAHDLVSYLVHYPVALNEQTVRGFLGEYLSFFNQKSAQKMTAQQLNAAVRFHLKLYMVTRFHAMISIAETVDMPYMPISIQNFLYLFSSFPFGDQF